MLNFMTFLVRMRNNFSSHAEKTKKSLSSFYYPEQVYQFSWNFDEFEFCYLPLEWIDRN